MRARRRPDAPEGLYGEFSARFPYEETDDQAERHRRGAGRSVGRPADGPADLRRRRLRQDRSGAARRLRRRDGRRAGGRRGADDAAGAPAFQDLFAALLRGFPVRVRQASRLVGAKELDETKKGMAEGTVDIVVGTHALLGAAIKFANLGLLIIDEEQHFGVKHKERLEGARRATCMC